MHCYAVLDYLNRLYNDVPLLRYITGYLNLCILTNPSSNLKVSYPNQITIRIFFCESQRIPNISQTQNYICNSFDLMFYEFVNAFLNSIAIEGLMQSIRSHRYPFNTSHWKDWFYVLIICELFDIRIILSDKRGFSYYLHLYVPCGNYQFLVMMCKFIFKNYLEIQFSNHLFQKDL